MNISKLLCIFLAISCFVTLSHQECIHDQLNIELEELPHEEVDPQGYGRNLASSWGPLRIRADFSHFSGSSSTKSYIQNKLLPPIFDYFAATLQVQQLSSLKLSSSACGLSVPSTYRSGVSADIVFFITGERSSSSWIAWAKPCQTLSSTGRAISGQINFNLNDIVSSTDSEFEKDMMTAMHEMTHVLGISQSLFPKYINRPKQGTTTANGRSTPYLSTPILNEKIQEHFGCSKVVGALLENQGGSGSAGSHFERRVFMNEFMTASATTDMRITKFSLALLESSGWYKVNYDMADNFAWGKDEGCSFITGSCKSSSFDEFCSSSGSAGCNYHRTHGASCRNTDKFGDSCSYQYAYSNADCNNPSHKSRAVISGEYYGEGSKCFMGTLYSSGSIRSKRSYCLKYECEDQGNGNYHLKVIAGSKSGTCKSKGSLQVSGYSGSIDCPDPDEFCTGAGKKTCKRGCMGRGTCRSDGTCDCDSGFSGAGCIKSGSSYIQKDEEIFAPDFDPEVDVEPNQDDIMREDSAYEENANENN